MTDKRHTARMDRGQTIALGAWLAAGVGFVAYLANVDAVVDAYGGVGTGIVLLMWLTLFSVLHYATPDLRRRAQRPLPAPTAPTPAVPRPSAIADRVDLVVRPSAALRNPAAQGRMMSALGPRAVGLSDRETDLMDWGFAFGVAWAVARNQDPAAPEELVSVRALHATQAVYEAYRGDTTPVPLER